jgi:hypothetical protein
MKCPHCLRDFRKRGGFSLHLHHSNACYNHYANLNACSSQAVDSDNDDVEDSTESDDLIHSNESDVFDESSNLSESTEHGLDSNMDDDNITPLFFPSPSPTSPNEHEPSSDNDEHSSAVSSLYSALGYGASAS